MKLFEEFKLYENLFEDVATGNEHPWMKDVPLKYSELNMGSNPDDPEDDMLIKDFTYLEGPEDVAEVLGNLITEEDVAGTGYDFQTVKADHNAWYDFLDTNFNKLLTKYDEELLNAFEDRAKEAAIRDAEDDYYTGNSEYIHETLVPDHDADIKIVKDVRNLLKELGSGESYIHGSWNQDFVILAGEDRTNSRLRNALKNLGCTELANAHDVNKLLIPKTFKHTDNSLDEAGSKNEDNLARMRRQIRDEIAGYEIEKAFDPDNAWDYDEKIKACKAELAQLANQAPSKATLKRRAVKAKQKEKIKEIERRLRYAFRYLSKYFGHPPHCEVLKDGNWFITFKRSLTPAATTEAIDICSKAGLQIEHSAEHSNNCSAFKLDVSNSNLDNYYSAWMNDIDYDAIEARLEAEQNNNVNDETEVNEQGSLKENTTMDKTQYQLQLQAWDKKYYEDSYTDNDATGNTYGDLYEYIGDLGSIIKKLNTISKKYEFSFINIYVNGTDECVFDAGTTDSTAEEDEFGDLPEVDENTVFINKIIPESAPFMKQFIIGPKGKYNPNSLAEACEYEYELTDIDKRFLDHIRYKAQQNKLTQAPKQVFDISKYPGKRVNCCMCGTECIDNSDVTGIPVEYVAWKTVFGPCCDECFEYGDDDLIQSTNSFIMASNETDWLETRFDLADAAEQRAAIAELAGLVSAWNTAKKDTRFVYTKAEAEELEKEFISNAAEVGFEIDPRIFNLNQDTTIIASKINSELTESYRRVVSRGKTLADNPLFVDFD
jgi:hypothetical protein